MLNKLQMKLTPLSKLKVGEATLHGPYQTANAASAKINACQRTSKCEHWEFTQRQLMLCDIGGQQVYKMYLITRTK